MEQVAPHMRGLLLGLEETIVAVPQSSGGGKGKAPSKPPKDKRLETRNAASSLLGWLRTDMQADFAALAPQGFSMATAKLLGNVLSTAESTDQPAASNSEARAEDLRVKSEVQGGSANAVSEINALKEELELWRILFEGKIKGVLLLLGPVLAQDFLFGHHVRRVHEDDHVSVQDLDYADLSLLLFFLPHRSQAHRDHDL